jgi:DNA-binding protein H-NS
MVDIASLSLVELQELERQIPREIRRRKAEERQKAIKELENYAKSRGFQLNELVASAPVRTRAYNKADPKFRDPQNPERTWTGRGRKPRWVETWITNGGSLSELEI